MNSCPHCGETWRYPIMLEGGGTFAPCWHPFHDRPRERAGTYWRRRLLTAAGLVLLLVWLARR